jgi:ketosteroid isomerase-like protein
MSVQPTTRPVETVELLIEALKAQDLATVLDLYAADADWEIHVPGWDTRRSGREDLAERLIPWFIERVGYEIAGYAVLEQGNTVALRWEQHWFDQHDGAPCTCHQSHFFEVEDGLIRRQWMYCSGVMAHYPDED